MKKPSILFILCIALVLVALSPVALAQTTRGRVQGLVTDESGAVVPNATVTLLNVNTQVKVARQTAITGAYLFDNVDPGNYSVTVEMKGFSKLIQENILVQTGGDVTVNVGLKTGSVQTTVTVTETPGAIEFNSTNNDITLDSKMVEDVPRLERNPFKLTLIAPTAFNTRGEIDPYMSWGANSVDLGGGTNLNNELRVDGSPLTTGYKATVVPNMDSLQEVVVSTNSVDAETGHSGGGAITITTKSGTNDWHGSAYWLGRYPWSSAMYDRTTFALQNERRNLYGGTLGNPILKNKLFNFFSIERWNVNTPSSTLNTTTPTDLERAGDFSQTCYDLGGGNTGLRTIYDPAIPSVVDPATGEVTRTPFAGNKIPASRFDPGTKAMMDQIWKPNNAGIGCTHTNNFQAVVPSAFQYYNYSDRADYVFGEKWKFFGRFAKYSTNNQLGNPTGSPLYPQSQTYRAGWSVGGDAVWAVNPRTLVSVHGDYHTVADSLISPENPDVYSQFWPSNNWYQNYLDAMKGEPIYTPNVNIGNGVSFGGGEWGYFWNQNLAAQAWDAKIAQQVGSHYMKAGFEFRHEKNSNIFNTLPTFNFNTALTAQSYKSGSSADTSGSGYATMLLGGLDSSSYMIAGPAEVPESNFFGFYFQDDWKVNRKITLNLGIRDEYESAYHDADQILGGLDLSAANPAYGGGKAPVMPPEATSLVGSDYYSWNGSWYFIGGDRPGMWNPQKLALQPRVGIAYGINDKTVLRAGYSIYMTPTAEMYLNGIAGQGDVNAVGPPYYGVFGSQNTLGPLEGVPQAYFNNPFPASSNPLNPILGKASGPQLGTGGSSFEWYPRDLKKAHNQRFNVSLQHEFRGQFVVSATYFLNLGSKWYSKALNQANPQTLVANESALSTSVANPFYHYLDNTLVPGPLWNQPNVTLSQLLVKYPQYGSLVEMADCCAGERYNSFEIKAQKMFSKGYNFLLTYVYIRERAEWNTLTDYSLYANQFIWQNSDQPRHRFNAAGTYQIPVGKGRTYMTDSNRAVDAIIGGWQLTGLLTIMSGDYINFNGGSGMFNNPQSGNMIWNGKSPCISNPSPQSWFDTSVFSPIPSNVPFTPRSNPYLFDCLTGPSFLNLDSTISKTFNITEKWRLEMRMNAYNALNNLNRGDPSTGFGPTFGQALYQGSPGGVFGQQGNGGGIAHPTNVAGRQLEFGLKLFF
jgi:hypothetical protein